MIPRAAILCQKPAANFCADCELDHIHPRITGARWGSPDGASRFQCPDWQGRLALYCAGGLVFCARLAGDGAREFSRLSRSSTLLDPSSCQPSKAAGSAKDLDRANVPAGARMHTPPHRVAVAIVVIGIASLRSTVLFGIDRSIVAGRAIVRPRRAIPNLPLRFNDNAILLVRRRNDFR